MITEIMEKAGLTVSEAKIYECLLRHKELKTSDILKEANINSGRIYDILANLQKKGFISIVVKKGVKWFKAAPPTILESYTREKEENIKKIQQQIHEVMPQLNQLYIEQQDEVSVEVYTDMKGMRTSYEILFNEAKKDKNLYVTGITTQAKYNKWLPTLIKTYIYPERKRLGLKVKKLMNLEAKKESLWKEDRSEIKYLPITALTSYEILGDVIIIQIFSGDSISLVIKNKQVAEDFKEQFNILWKIAKN